MKIKMRIDMLKNITVFIALVLLMGVTSAGTSYVHANGQRIAKINDTGVYYIHSDHLGSTSAITNSNGEVIEEQVNLPFGEQISGGERYGFTGKELDETGLQYFGARYYSPLTGRFLTSDSAKDGANWYGYANQNPISYTDPTGNSPWSSIKDGWLSAMDWLWQESPISNNYWNKKVQPKIDSGVDKAVENKYSRPFMYVAAAPFAIADNEYVQAGAGAIVIAYTGYEAVVVIRGMIPAETLNRFRERARDVLPAFRLGAKPAYAIEAPKGVETVHLYRGIQLSDEQAAELIKELEAGKPLYSSAYVRYGWEKAFKLWKDGLGFIKEGGLGKTGIECKVYLTEIWWSTTEKEAAIYGNYILEADVPYASVSGREAGVYAALNLKTELVTKVFNPILTRIK